MFRARLLQRRVARYAKPLALADAFAWCCYRPVAAAAGVPEILARGFEPPLVSCEGLEAPDVLVRGSSFAAELVGTPETLTAVRDRHAAIVRGLPVPLVGLPWGSLSHLPDMLLLAHEVGHVADADFGISKQLYGVGAEPSALPELRLPGSPWLNRLREAVADVYGALAAGPPFVFALELLLEPWLSAEAAGQPADPLYPPAVLRLRMTARAVMSQQPAAQGAAVASALPPTAAKAALEANDPEATTADRLADAIMGTKLHKLGDVSLGEAFARPSPLAKKYLTLLEPAGLFAEAKADSKRLLAGTAPASTDTRALVGAAMLAFLKNPANYAAYGVAALVLARARAVQPIGVLGKQDPAADRPDRVSFNVLAALRDETVSNLGGGMGQAEQRPG